MNNSHAPRIPSHPPAKREPATAPKVAICVPSGDTVCKGFAMALAAMTYVCGPREEALSIPIALVGVEGSLIVRNRCEAVAQAQALQVDYLLFLDSDMQFPPATLRRLLSHEKDIVGATYVQRDPPHLLLGQWMPDTLLTSDRLHEVLALPAGCLLIKLSVFEGMAMPYFRTPAFEADGDAPAHIQGEDYYFCQVARERGHQIWLDVALSSQIGHIGKTVSKIGMKRTDQPQEAPDGQTTAIY